MRALRVLKALTDAVFPAKCYSCDGLFNAGPSISPEKPSSDDVFNHGLFYELLNAFFCPDCLSEFRPLTPPYCLMCGVMFKSRLGENRLCGECITEPKLFDSAVAPGVYTGSLKKAVIRLKYNAAVELHKPLGYLLYLFFKTHFKKEAPDLVVPVPLYWGKMKKRGFNQSHLLVKNWPLYEKSTACEKTSFELLKEGLIKIKSTLPQAGSQKMMREQSIKGAFTVPCPDTIKGRSVLLVDDVLTTGSTANECARVLKKAGAKNVHVLTVARTLEKYVV